MWVETRPVVRERRRGTSQKQIGQRRFLLPVTGRWIKREGGRITFHRREKSVIGAIPSPEDTLYLGGCQGITFTWFGGPFI